jgi:hypothetical protein
MNCRICGDDGGSRVYLRYNNLSLNVRETQEAYVRVQKEILSERDRQVDSPFYERLTNSMELSLSWEADSRSASQELVKGTWRFITVFTMVSILSQINPGHPIWDPF